MAFAADFPQSERSGAPSISTLPRTLVVIPTYNEIDNIVPILDRLREANPTVDVLVVDDGSPDGTADRVRWVMPRMDGLHLLERTSKDGLGAAYRAGFAWGLDQDYEILVEMDADGSHRPEDLPKLLAAIANGADLAIGSRYVAGGEIPNWKLSRKALSRGGNEYASRLLHLGVHDATAGFRAYRNTLLRRIDFAGLRATGYGFQIEGAWKSVRAGAYVIEVPIRFEDRAFGESKMSKAIVVEALTLVTKWGVSDRLHNTAARVGRLFRSHTDGPNWSGASLAGSKRGH
ncbi:MAG: polyprenol monophosphomannose synthase [Acidimicrobiales bacterium]|nr:polyprenol monophosphomannose synthase [Acidimicrobiales bacterium]